MNRYTEEEKKFLASYIPGHSIREVSAAFLKRFDKEMSPGKVHAYKTNHKIRSGTKKGIRKGSVCIFPPEIKAFFVENNKGKTAQELSDLIYEKFKIRYTRNQVKGFRARMHLDSGLDGRFRKGHIPPNKGKKGICAPGSEKGWFKKGFTPWNKVKVGTIAKTTDGYLKKKIAEPNIWRHLHLLIWEQEKGPVPAGSVITFRDGNPLNCNIGNLACISQSENSVLNVKKLRTKGSADLTDTGILIARLAVRSRRKKRK